MNNGYFVCLLFTKCVTSQKRDDDSSWVIEKTPNLPTKQKFVVNLDRQLEDQDCFKCYLSLTISTLLNSVNIPR